MRSSAEDMENRIMDTTNRLSALSIVIDDFDSAKHGSYSEPMEQTSNPMVPVVQQYQSKARPYTRHSSDENIRRILEEAEQRKHDFWKLLEEHNALIQYLKRIEQMEHNMSLRKTAAVST